MLFKAQFTHDGGNGWMQIARFIGDGSGMAVETFSPYFAKRLELGLDASPPNEEGPEYRFRFINHNIGG